jgi:hypothetical protein
LAAVTALGLLAAACGGSSSGEGVAQVEMPQTTSDGQSSSSGSSSADPAAYASCMRTNGVPKFSDPDAQGRLTIIGGPGLDPSSPRFKAAEKACEQLLPRGGGETPDPEELERARQEALAYSACMRENGVPGFPDPKPNAEGGISLSPEAGAFDPSSPQFKVAEQACKGLAPGANGGATQRQLAPGRRS